LIVVFADHGNLITALPFVVPPLLLICGLAFLAVRDRWRKGWMSAGPAE